uniref:CCHC-type domain-containing protein n=1 Tax=Tanacetum cinerariifolium TaxID=118510 RepID=A0A6L2KDL9_TANCI|nr:hypothetical protein [Tanacetum cinerariifolium]
MDEERLAFLADPGVSDDQVAQTITRNAAFQTDDLDAYDSDCDDISSAIAVFMASLSSCDSDVLSENTKFVAFETEIDILKQALSKHVKEKESLLTTLNGFKREFKEKESKSIDKEIVLENKNKELKNIVCLHDEITEVQTVFTQMEAVVEQCSCFEIQQKQFLIENDQLLDKLISQEIVNIMLNSIVIICDFEKKNQDFVDTCNKCLELKVKLIKKNDVYIELSKRFSNLEQHCISFEVSIQLNKEIFQKDKSSDNQNNPKIQEYFEQNDLKAQQQAKETVISKLKETIYSLRENTYLAKVKQDIDEIETIIIELEHTVAKLLSEEKLHKEKVHLKKTYKELYDSIKPTCVRAKEECKALIVNLNFKSMENAYLKAQIKKRFLLNTLAEYMILSGADNRPPMLDKDLYDFWKSRMELYMQNKEHGRMILESVERLLIWPTVKENGVTRTKKYVELSAAKKIQAGKKCKLYDAFDKFTHIKRESLHNYYLRFTQLINDINIYNMKMEQFQVNTKFLNSLPLEWSKFMTDVKLVKFDQLHAYLEQNELYANEVRLLRELNQDPLAFVANQQMTPPHFNTYYCSFLKVPLTNNQLRTFSNTRNQATIQDERVTVKQVQGRQRQSYSGTGYKSNATSSRGNNASEQARVVKCYNCQGEGHMARQCIQPKRPRNIAWYKDKAMLAEAQEAGQILDEEQLTFLADPGVPNGQAAQTIIPNNAAF